MYLSKLPTPKELKKERKVSITSPLSLEPGSNPTALAAPYCTSPALSKRVGTKPNPKYPTVSRAKATIIALRKPILSEYAPTNVGKKYNNAENEPAIIPASTSLKPHTLDRYKVNEIKIA